MIGDRQSPPRAEVGPRIAIALILVLFAGLAATYSIVTPLFEGNDEPWHFAYVHHIAGGNGLPRQPPDQYPHLARQEASQPPLYYALAAAVTSWMPSDDLATYLRENPFYTTMQVSYRDNQNHLIHTDAERFPYQGTVLAVHMVRLLSVLFGTGTVYCTYVMGSALFPGEKKLALAGMLVAGLTPGFLFASGLVNNDTLVIFLSSVTAVLLVRLWKREASYPTVALLGIVLGCAALTKLSGLLLWPLAGLTLAILAWRKRGPGWFLRVAGLTFSLAGLLCGWWYVRNWVLYGDVTGLNMMLDLVGRREPGFGLRDMVAELGFIRRSYWALFGWFNVPAAGWLYRVFDFLALLALIGLGVDLARAVRDRCWSDLLATLFLFSWTSVSILGVVGWTRTTGGSQGRLLYPAIIAISILLVRGWLGLFGLLPHPGKVKTGAVTGISLAFLAIAVYVPFFLIAPTYARPASLSPEEVDQRVSQRVLVHFEDEVTILGYRVDRQEVNPGDLVWVTVCWEGKGNLQEDTFVFARLLVEHDLPAAKKHTYHGVGSFPTSLWPDDLILCDDYPLIVEDTAPASSQGTISIGLYRTSGEPLQAYDGEGRPMGDSVRLPGPAIVFPESGRTLDYHWGHQIALLDYELNTAAVVAGGRVEITLYWQALRRMVKDHAVTVQIMDDEWNKIAQNDNTPSTEGKMTSAWQPGTVVTDRRTIQIPPDALPGVYEIKVAVYDPSTIQNLTLYRDRQVLPVGGLMTLWRLRVLPGEP